MSDSRQLIQRLNTAGDLPPCTVIAGDEPLLVTEVADAFRAAATRLGCTERTHLVMDARSDWSTVLAAAQNSSLFGDLRLLELSLPTGKPGKTGSETLQRLGQLATDGSLPDVRLLIRLPALDRATQQSKWAKVLKAQAVWTDIHSVGRAELPPWISHRLEIQGQTITPEALQWLVDKVEGNLLAAHQEIQKLGLLHPGDRLTLEQVQAAVLNVARYNLYDLRDAMLQGDAARALTVLEGLHAEGEALVLVLWVIGEEIRILSRIAVVPPARRDAELRAHRVFGGRERLLRHALNRIPDPTWPSAIRHVHQLDRLIKGLPEDGLLDEPWHELARLVMRIATAERPRA